MAKFNAVNEGKNIEGTIYQYQDCFGTRNRAESCSAKKEAGVSVPSILTLKSQSSYTYFNDAVDFKLDLNNFGSDISVRGYFNQYGSQEETVLMIFNNLKHVHTFVAKGYQELKESTIISNDSNDLIPGLTQNIAGITYYNSHCDRVDRELKCKSVSIDGAIKPTQFHISDLSSGKDGALTRIDQPLPKDFIINVANLPVTKEDMIDVMGKDQTQLSFKNSDGKIVHDVIIDFSVAQIEESHISFENNVPYIFNYIESAGLISLCDVNTCLA